MEETDKYSLCILCCFSFQNASKSPHPDDKTSRNAEALNKFLRQTGIVNQTGLSSSELLNPGQVSLCPQCLSAVTKAVDKQEQVEEVEVQVRHFQEEILRLMRQLRGMVDGYLEEMRRLEETIKCSDEGCLRSRFSGIKKKKDGWTKENVFQFRKGIINVVQELGQFGQDLNSKLLEDDGQSTDDLLKKCVKIEQDDDSNSDFNDDGLLDTCYDDIDKMTKSKSDKKFPCPDCGKVFKVSKTLKKHIACLHSNLRPFHCPECPKSFKTQQHLSEHSKIHQRLVLGTPPKFKCHLCTKAYFKKSHLDGHLRIHKGTGFTCHECGRMCISQSQLQNHLKGHEKQKEVKCWLCDKCDAKFREEKMLERHKKFHQKGKESRCDVCNKVFEKPSKLDVHVRSVHLKERLHTCGICGKSLARIDNLRQHMERVHPDSQKKNPHKPKTPSKEIRKEVAVNSNEDSDSETTTEPQILTVHVIKGGKSTGQS